MMHRKWLKQLSSHLDGELSEIDTKKMEIHLSDCPVCREQFEKWKSIESAGKSTLLLKPEERIWQGIRQRINIEIEKPLHIWEDDWIFKFIPNPISAIAVAAVVVLIVFVTQPYFQNGDTQIVSVEQYLTNGTGLSNANMTDITYILAGENYENGYFAND